MTSMTRFAEARRPVFEPRSADASLKASRRRAQKEKAIELVIGLFAMTGIAAVVLIFVFIGKETLPLLFDPATRAEAGFDKMFTAQPLREGRPFGFMWQPVSGVPKVSMLPLFVGTLKVTLIAMTLAVPLALAAAVFTTEFASRRLREWLKPTIELLAGVPSVVLGFFTLMVLASFTQAVFGTTYRLNGWVAGIGLGIAIIPVIYTVTEDALMAVPQSYREASYALGASRWQTAWRIILPAATPGVTAACVLGFGRAVGETMIVLMASGNAAVMSANPFASIRSLSATIAAEMGEVVSGSPHYTLLFFIGIELFVMTFTLNLIASLWSRRMARRSLGAAK